MSDQNSKTYTAEEAAVLVLKKTEELLKASSLIKSNTSHEVENGQEPSTEDAECPAYLAEADIESGSSTGKHGEAKAGGAEVGEAGSEGEDLDEDGNKKKKEGEEVGEDVPEHEEGMDAETKAAHDATEGKSDKEESKDDDAVAAQKADEADADKIEDKEEKKKENAIEKSLFEDKAISVCEEAKPTKSDVFYDIKRCVERLKDMKELKWTVTEDAPEAKNAFEKEFTKEKSKLAGYVKKYNGLKKSEDINEDESSFMAKAEAYVAKACKGSECGQMPTDLKKPNKLKSFMQKRELKKKAPKGVDPAAHERCVTDVKRDIKPRKGQDKVLSCALEKGLFKLDEGFTRLVYQPTDLVGTPYSCLVLRRLQKSA